MPRMQTFAATIVAVLALFPTAHAQAAATCALKREAATIPLSDFQSPAEIVTPPEGIPKRGLLVLFAGSDVADMDGAIVGPEGAIVSRPMRQVADRLACAGFASLRFNKRYVSGATTVDRNKFDTLDGADLVADDGGSGVRAESDLSSLVCRSAW